MLKRYFKKKPCKIGLSERETCVIKGKAFIICDFGKEHSGGARIRMFLAQGERRVRLRFGESVAETCADLKDGEAGYGATNEHALRDFGVQLQNYSGSKKSAVMFTGVCFLRKFILYM